MLRVARSAFLLLTLTASAGCGDVPAGGMDAGAPGDADVAQDAGVGADLTWLSECPAARELAPSDAPSGYFEPVTVTLDHPTDGDTASFVFPQTSWFAGGKHTVRYLYVNTEESFGDETTPFGTRSKEQMAAWLRGASRIDVVVRKGNDGKPELDPYERWLGLVFIDGALVQTRLVREGWSGYYTQYGCAQEPVHSSLLYAEAEANATDVGIWAPGHPRDYRLVFEDWIGRRTCRPDPFKAPYCR